MAVRPEGAEHQWRKIPPGELSINPDADERLAGVLHRYSVAGRYLIMQSKRAAADVG